MQIDCFSITLKPLHVVFLQFQITGMAIAVAQLAWTTFAFQCTEPVVLVPVTVGWEFKAFSTYALLAILIMLSLPQPNVVSRNALVLVQGECMIYYYNYCYLTTAFGTKLLLLFSNPPECRCEDVWPFCGNY